MLDVSNNYISNIERNESIPSIETLVKICNALDVTPDFILLDSLYTGKEYLKDNIAKLIKNCTKDELDLIERVVTAILNK